MDSESAVLAAVAAIGREERADVRETAVLIDLSSIAHPIYHMSQGDPDPNHTSVQTVAKVRALASGAKHVAVCCDAGRSFRHEIDATYKANRPESEATLQHQIMLAREQLAVDGFPVWRVEGFEADDVIATAARLAQDAGLDVLIVSSDKDLMQLVGPRATQKSVRDGTVVDVDGVMTKFGVRPDQMRDFLSLVGDASDNVRGAKGIGPKGAVRLLLKFETIDKLYDAIDEAKGDAAEVGLKPSEATSLEEFRERYQTVRSLIALRDDVPIPFSELTGDRVPKEVAKFTMAAEAEEEEPMETETIASAEKEAPPVAFVEAEKMPAKTDIAVREKPGVIDAVPVEWERQLDPRNGKEARLLAVDLFESRLFSAYGSPQAVLTTIMSGRELGFPAMAALRAFHIIDGKGALSAISMVAVVLRSGLAAYFRPVEFDDTKAVYETLRIGEGNRPVTMTHTIEMGRIAWPKKYLAGGAVDPSWERSFLASGWGRNPTDMLVARCQSRLCRMIYADLLGGLYTPEELEEMRRAA